MSEPDIELIKVTGLTTKSVSDFLENPLAFADLIAVCSREAENLLQRMTLDQKKKLLQSGQEKVLTAWVQYITAFSAPYAREHDTTAKSQADCNKLLPYTTSEYRYSEEVTEYLYTGTQYGRTTVFKKKNSDYYGLDLSEAFFKEQSRTTAMRDMLLAILQDNTLQFTFFKRHISDTPGMSMVGSTKKVTRNAAQQGEYALLLAIYQKTPARDVVYDLFFESENSIFNLLVKRLPHPEVRRVLSALLKHIAQERNETLRMMSKEAYQLLDDASPSLAVRLPRIEKDIQNGKQKKDNDTMEGMELRSSTQSADHNDEPRHSSEELFDDGITLSELCIKNNDACVIYPAVIVHDLLVKPDRFVKIATKDAAVAKAYVDALWNAHQLNKFTALATNATLTIIVTTIKDTVTRTYVLQSLENDKAQTLFENILSDNTLALELFQCFTTEQQQFLLKTINQADHIQVAKNMCAKESYNLVLSFLANAPHAMRETVFEAYGEKLCDASIPLAALFVRTLNNTNFSKLVTFDLLAILIRNKMHSAIFEFYLHAPETMKAEMNATTLNNESVKNAFILQIAKATIDALDDFEKAGIDRKAVRLLVVSLGINTDFAKFQEFGNNNSTDTLRKLTLVFTDEEIKAMIAVDEMVKNIIQWMEELTPPAFIQTLPAGTILDFTILHTDSSSKVPYIDRLLTRIIHGNRAALFLALVQKLDSTDTNYIAYSLSKHDLFSECIGEKATMRVVFDWLMGSEIPASGKRIWLYHTFRTLALGTYLDELSIAIQSINAMPSDQSKIDFITKLEKDHSILDKLIDKTDIEYAKSYYAAWPPSLKRDAQFRMAHVSKLASLMPSDEFTQLRTFSDRGVRATMLVQAPYPTATSRGRSHSDPGAHRVPQPK